MNSQPSSENRGDAANRTISQSNRAEPSPNANYEADIH
jgi:hypothetical protein